MREPGFSTIDNDRYYTISHSQRMAEFFMSLVSSGNHWMFISSNGALSAGRESPEKALFPYETVDKIMAGRGRTGTRTIIRIVDGSRPLIWEPFSDWSPALWQSERSLSKNFTSSAILFEESNLDLGLEFSWSWTFSHRFGFVRKATLLNSGDKPKDIELADGLLNLMNGGLDRRVQANLSCLGDAYKESSLDRDTGIACFGLASIVGDRPEPREALRVTSTWQHGLDGPRISLCRDSLATLLSARELAGLAGGKDSAKGRAPDFPGFVSGKKADFILHGSLTLQAGESKSWYIVADVGLDHQSLEELRGRILEGPVTLAAELETEAGLIRKELETILASSDGLSCSAREMHQWHHGANTLFNVMRGGLPEGGMQYRTSDVQQFLLRRNPALGRTFVPPSDSPAMSRDELLGGWGAGAIDRQRLSREYLPFVFSRRHGDPSRPWNEFAIRVRDQKGNPLVHYQGNWRDIFQNWESLGQSYPGYLESFLTIFLNATTMDGYNPYRISRDGIDWEKIDPDNPWSHIGYWNDHQIIYFQKLAESLEAHYPDTLVGLLDKRRFSWADVPYRIRSYAELCRDPRSSILFDTEKERVILDREKHLGSDGRLVLDEAGKVVHASLAEKIISLLGAKLANLVPGGGIWLNTQRPEWNDANNALAGFGLSMVTVMYLRRFLNFWIATVRSSGLKDIELGEALARLVKDQQTLLSDRGAVAAALADPVRRKVHMDAMGLSAEVYRKAVYAGASAKYVRLPLSLLICWMEEALELVDATIRYSLRPDGLCDSYSFLSFEGVPRGAEIHRLQPMLEGQVAALSSGFFGSWESLDLLKALRESPMYAADRKSWLLYPERELPLFRERNSCPPDILEESALARALVAEGNRDLLYRDASGTLRFGAGLENAAELAMALAALDEGGRYPESNEKERQAILAAYEKTFHHGAFTGRSGGMYAYEGIGSIYWHMVAKLLLAVMECRQAALLRGEEPELVQAFEDYYSQIRDGLGYRKTPEEWGAFPADPYSHTPQHAGAQQPGMTGQVKEELLTRLGEYGVQVMDGCIYLLPSCVLEEEYLEAPAQLSYLDVQGRSRQLNIQAGQLGFTFCQVPFLRNRSKEALHLRVTLVDGTVQDYGNRLDRELSRSIFDRRGLVQLVEIYGL
jgi:hypothetical protein